MAARPEFKVGTWIEKARNLGTTPEEKDLYEWNARVQVTTWGNRVAADEGGLRDYAHKERPECICSKQVLSVDMTVLPNVL